MAATGNETIKLSQLKTWWTSVYSTITSAIAAKLDKPGTDGAAGQVLTWNGTTTAWTTVETGETYTGTAPINVSGTTISVADAGDGTKGVVMFASDSDFTAYMAG